MSRHVWFRVATLGCGLLILGVAVLLLDSHAPANVQRLPEPWIGMRDDIQYFSPGPEFKLSREAAALKAYRAEMEAQQNRE
jgi:hypothetical protein